jgi:hypothetical protein
VAGPIVGEHGTRSAGGILLRGLALPWLPMLRNRSRGRQRSTGKGGRPGPGPCWLGPGPDPTATGLSVF